MAKKIILVVVIVLFLVVGGFFWWQNRETLIEKWESAEVSSEEDYMAKETSEGTIVENEKMGLIYKIPKDWILEKGNPSIFYSSDIKLKEKRSDILEKGCKVYIDASYIKTNFNTLERFIDENFSKLSLVIKIDEKSKTEVSNYPALRYEYNAENLKMAYISIDILSKNNLYKILLSNPIQEKGRCEQEFDKFLETVLINPY